jgi:hypothetical protein
MSRALYFGRCLACGDEWTERTPPAVCPECHSLDVVDDTAERSRFAGLGSDVVRTIAAGGPGTDNAGSEYQAAARRELEHRERVEADR